MRKIVLGLFLLLQAAEAFPHGIQIDVEKKIPFVIIHIAYSGERSVPDADVRIFGPGDLKKAYQRGKTDLEGRFVFQPDRPGQWTLVADDGGGHRDTLSVDLSSLEEEPAQEEPGTPQEEDMIASPHHSVPMVYKAVFGLALIFGITGTAYGFKSARVQKR